jgi:putative holliday junction resolvase
VLLCLCARKMARKACRGKGPVSSGRHPARPPLYESDGALNEAGRMVLAQIEDLAGRLGKAQRLMGIDLGTKTIGLALSDVERRLATPLETLERGRFSADAAKLLARAKEFDVAAFVVGLPLNMDGSEGPRVQATRAFVRNLGKLSPIPCVFWDERLSTAAVTRALIAQDVSRAKRAEVIDRMAAAYILQGALDRLNRAAAG